MQYTTSSVNPKSSIGTQLTHHFQRTTRKLKGIKVYALVGPAGTGKSFRARLIADREEIEAIIDDGLLIFEGKILAGKSAKQEALYFSAVKTSLFNEDSHRNEVTQALGKAKFHKILILGTSERMILRNCETLHLPKPHTIFKIEDIASQAEIEAARKERKLNGRHVIPVPVIEVKQAYPKLIARAVHVWIQRHMHPHRGKTPYEKTIVRPAYRNKGSVTISENALIQMVLHCLMEKAPQITAEKIRIQPKPSGYRIHLNLRIPFGIDAADTCLGLHAYMLEKIGRYAGIQIEKLSIQIEKVQAPDSPNDHR